MIEITAHPLGYDYAAAENVTTREGSMLLWLMIICAAGAVLLFAMAAFSDLQDVWKHPDHRPGGEYEHLPETSGPTRSKPGVV